MRHLYEIVNEGINQALKDKLLKLLDDPNLTDKVAQNMINIGKYQGRMGLSTGKMTTGVRKKYVDNSENRKLGRVGQEQNSWDIKPEEIFDNDEYGIYKYLSNIDIYPSKIKEIVNILINNNMMDRFIKYIKKPWFTSNDLIKGANIYDGLKSTKISKLTLHELAFLEDTKKSISQGKFEILIKMFLSDINENNTQYSNQHHGDIYAGGKSFELKGKDARPFTQGSPEIDNTNKVLNDWAGQHGVKFDNNPLGSITNIENTVKTIYEIEQDDRKVFDVIFDALCSQFEGEKEYTSGMFKLSNADKNKLTKAIFNKGKINNVLKNNGVSRLMLAIQLYDYWIKDGFEYFVLFNIDNGVYDCVNTEQFSIMNIFFDQPHIGVKNGTGGTKGTKRDSFVNMIYQ